MSLMALEPEVAYQPQSFDDVDLLPLELEVLKRLRSVVEHHGLDYKYQPDIEGQCQYFETKLVDPHEYDPEIYEEGSCGVMDVPDLTRPSCLVGHVFADMGLTGISDGNNEAAIGSVYEIVFDEYPESERSPQLAAALAAAQQAQDAGKTWGTALHLFESFLKSNVTRRMEGVADGN